MLTEAENVTVSPSTSLADNSTVYEVSSSTLSSDNSERTGASLIGVTVNVNVVDDAYSPSEASTVTVASPL